MNGRSFVEPQPFDIAVSGDTVHVTLRRNIEATETADGTAYTFEQVTYSYALASGNDTDEYVQEHFDALFSLGERAEEKRKTKLQLERDVYKLVDEKGLPDALRAIADIVADLSIRVTELEGGA